jgi:stage II sporulation protein D
MFLRPLAVAALAALSLAGPAASASVAPVCTGSCFAAPAGSGPLFVFSGHGWGHGVGMSQYGAYGYAQHGWTAPQILAHYYPGTTLSTAPAATIRVLVADKQATLELSSGAPFTVVGADGQQHTLAAGSITLTPALKLVVDGAAKPTALTPPLTFAPGAAANLTLGRPYRGKIEVDLVDGKLRAIDVVGLEQYLDGVVPSEMPSRWPAEALKAQAVAARSYALATRQAGAPFDVYADTRSQEYLGVAQEQASTTAAVTATKGQVLTYDGKVATTYFFSTSGGQTESALDWEGVDVPYLVSVSDPYDTLSPYHDWGPLPMTGQSVARALGLPGLVVDARPAVDPAGRVATLNVLDQARGADSTSTVPGTRVRTALRLRSTWFSVGVLSLAAPSPGAPVTYGSSVTLSGLARGVTGVVMQWRAAGSSWQTGSTVQAAGNGALQLTEKPKITTDYRLALPAAAGAYVRVRVAPRVRLLSAAAGQLQGTERPVLPGARVRVDRQTAAATWSPVARGAVDSAGRFTISLPLAAGATYRAVVTSGHGYSPGVSAPFTAGS